MNNKKILGIIIIAIIVLVTGASFCRWGSEKDAEIIENNEIWQQTDRENQKEFNVDTNDWRTYRDEKYGFEIKYPKEWTARSHVDSWNEADGGVLDIFWQNERITIFPTGKSGSSCYSKGTSGDFERLNIDKYTEEFFIKESDGGRFYECSVDMDNYPKSWNEKVFIEMEYSKNFSSTVKNILQSISFLENTIDQASLRLYGSRVGVRSDGIVMNTSGWLTEKNDTIDFSFRYPQNAKVINEGNCYRVEYDLGFVIFFLPVEGYMRCGARTGVGILPDNVDLTDHLLIGGEKYEASGFNAIIDTKGKQFFKPETRYSYDFTYMFNLNKKENCGNASECVSVGYGIYKKVKTPLEKDDINDTMNTLRTIIESVNVKM